MAVFPRDPPALPVEIHGVFFLTHGAETFGWNPIPVPYFTVYHPGFCVALEVAEFSSLVLFHTAIPAVVHEKMHILLAYKGQPPLIRDHFVCLFTQPPLAWEFSEIF